ncbi:unnamed protein product [Scytosiphon promiscuus]
MSQGADKAGTEPSLNGIDKSPLGQRNASDGITSVLLSSLSSKTDMKLARRSETLHLSHPLSERSEIFQFENDTCTYAAPKCVSQNACTLGHAASMIPRFEQMIDRATN